VPSKLALRQLTPGAGDFLLVVDAGSIYLPSAATNFTDLLVASVAASTVSFSVDVLRHRSVTCLTMASTVFGDKGPSN